VRRVAPLCADGSARHEFHLWIIVIIVAGPAAADDAAAHVAKHVRQKIA
jgi:hypothetical protein